MRYQSSPFIPQERQETTRERAERQRQERRAELTYTESDEKRWAENRERVLRERQQAADSAKNTPEDELILKSSLKQSKPLNDLAAGKFNPLKKGSTETEEIKKVQQALIDCGFDLGAFGADGDFGRATEGAVKQFQTHYKPTHTTHKSYQFGDVDGVVDKNTILALDEAVKEGWKFVDDEMDEKWLTVPKGQVTFNAEGNDAESSNYFSRKIHWPGNSNSGVTIGRGYDCGNRSQDEVLADLTNAGVFPHIAKLISESAGLKGENASQFVNENINKIDAITRKDQHNLFVSIYPEYESRAENNYQKWTENKESRVNWLELDSKIRDILVDFVYQGFTKGPKPMTKGMLNDRQVLIDYIEGSSVLNSYEPGRQRANYLRGQGE